MSDTRTNFLIRSLEWLRAGYPAGVPRQDYVALLGLLRRKLTDEEIHKIAQDLADQSALTADPISTQDIEGMINDAMLQQPTESDVARVSSRLAAGGWPLVDPPTA